MIRIYTENVTHTRVSILRIEGSMMTPTAADVLHESVQNALRQGYLYFVLDLTGLTRVWKKGTGEMVGSYTTVTNRGGKFVLACLNGQPREVLTLTQIITIFDVYDSVLEAVAAISDNTYPDGRDSEQAQLTALRFGSDVSQSNIVIPALAASTRLLAEHLLREPTSIYQLSPRKFEELIAEVVSTFGWRVQLTPATRDGGRDIVALIPSGVGDLLCLIEAKRYREDRKVGVGLVRQLWGTVNHEDASIGILVTSSSFSLDAQQFAEQHQSRIKLRARDAIFEWLGAYARSDSWRRVL